MWHLTKSGGSGGSGWKSLVEREINQYQRSTLEDEIGREFNLSIEKGDEERWTRKGSLVVL